MPVSEVYNTDCLDYMRTMPDHYFDLAVVDPPYELGNNSVSRSRHSGSGTLKNRVLNQNASKFEQWDVAPEPEYFDELFRISKNQIIWGGNYFPLPPSRCIICWDKVQPWENFSQIELAWTSYDSPAKLFRYDNRTGDKIHPTQKPVALYQWIFKNFTGGGMKILDTHLGSGSSRIAAYFAGLDFYGCEIDKAYFDEGCARFERECRGIERVNGKERIQLQLFE